MISAKSTSYDNSGYHNAIEPLVAAEVERQLKRLPPNLLAYINPAQVMAYALNRLPSLYATSQEGWQRQQERANVRLKNQIVTAVRQGLVTVQTDPLKASTPLAPKKTEPLIDSTPAALKKDVPKTRNKESDLMWKSKAVQPQERYGIVDGWDTMQGSTSSYLPFPNE